MKYSLVFVPVYCVLLLLISSPSRGQKASSIFKSKFIPEIETGVAIPTGAEVSDAFPVGGHMSIGGAVAVGTPKFIVKPVFGFKGYSKQLEEDNTITENFITWKVGLELQYQVLQMRKMIIGPTLRIDQNWSADYFSKQYYYGYGPYSYDVEKSDNIFSGKGVSADVGLLARFRVLYLKVHYEVYKPTLNVSKQIIQEAYNQGYIVEPTKQFNFNAINLTVGASLNF